MASTEPGKGFWQTFSFLTKVTYGGIIGKIAAIAIVFFLFLCVVAVAAHSVPLLLGGLGVLGLFALVFVVLRIEAIFKANPEMATLEGTDVIKYRQAELKSKNHIAIPVIEVTKDPALPARSQSRQLTMPDESEENFMNPHVLLITVAGDQINLDHVEGKLNGAKDWLRSSPGCWLVYTRQTADTWYERLADVVAVKGTQVFICEVNLEDRSGQLSPSAWTWMRDVRQKVTQLMSSPAEQQTFQAS